MDGSIGRLGEVFGFRSRRALGQMCALMLILVLGLTVVPGTVDASSVVTRYTIVFAGQATADGFQLTGGRQAALSLVSAEGGTVKIGRAHV